jgi:predicted enzyme related to lactoylglutathione lyase
MEGQFIFFSTPDGKNQGGFSAMGTPVSEGGPMLYITVESVSAKLEEIAAAGGATTMEPMALPGDGWGYIAGFSDPHGNVLGLWSMGE